MPTQARSRQRLRRVLDAADELLAAEGAGAFTTKAVARFAGIPVGSVYHYFPDKDAIAEALAVRYWSDFEDLVAGVAEADELRPFDDPGAAVLDVLAAGFRARPGFLALWYGGLRTEHLRDATRPNARRDRPLDRADPRRPLARGGRRSARRRGAGWSCSPATACCARRFGSIWPATRRVLAESKLMIDAYLVARLG